MDANGASIGGATLRLLNSVSEEVAHATSNDFGKFQVRIATPGSYVLTAWRPGFRSHKATVVLRSPNEVSDIGSIRLEVAGCDAPGVNCDWFGEAPPPDPVVSRGNMRIRTDCVVAFAISKVFCPGDPGRGNEDLRLTANESGVYLAAMNGASLSEPDLPRGDCRDAYPKEKQVRIDGLGPGDDICLYTHDRHWSHVFLTDQVRRDSREISVWQITRKR